MMVKGLLLTVLAGISAAAPTTNDFVKRSLTEGSSDAFNSVADTLYKTGLNDTAIYNELYLGAEYCRVTYCIATNHLVTGDIDSACPLDTCTDNTANIDVYNIWEDLVSGATFVNHDTKEIVVVFKGTTSIEEWLVDFTFVGVDYTPYVVQSDANTEEFTCDDCKVHEGFFVSIKAFINDGLPAVEKLIKQYPEYKLKVTGHSLGGALAPLGAIELQLLGYSPILVTYAGPKFGNSALIDWINDKYNTDSLVASFESHSLTELPTMSYTRVTHHGDIVPLVPLKQMGYAQGGCEIYIEAVTLPHPEDTVVVRGSWDVDTEYAVLEDKALVLLKLGAYQTVINEYNILSTHNSYFVDLSTCIYLILKRAFA
ncbi:hypothetical protein CANARDRAFT_26195 [[Candida] arabinofermentans NRRL YB-2248]|uniref:triacylglycerol lipase n=1 Tax=[Candida] arabinofermentans NRRL YB-2248 TaxID=983967 RepID=A0A1E4T8F0_9ASCO|nr:hypothetical protein CANARDRAFT_26195 [[Candida] arabinofermentans NRRL YB-2248]